MEEQTLAELLYAAVFPVKKQGKGCSEERKIWNSFLDQLNQGLDAVSYTHLDVYKRQTRHRNRTSFLRALSAWCRPDANTW